MTTRDRILAALRKRGPSTALELQHATGISATTMRRYLKPPTVIVHTVEWLPTGRGFVKYYALGTKDDLCDCGRQAVWRLSLVLLSADGKERTDSINLCGQCVGMLSAKEREKCVRVR